MSFANGLKKGHYFLNFEDEKEKVIKPTYAKGGLCQGWNCRGQRDGVMYYVGE